MMPFFLVVISKCRADAHSCTMWTYTYRGPGYDDKSELAEQDDSLIASLNVGILGHCYCN